MRTKVLLDTDIGTDIDDAVCLAYLLANPACDLLGITTVTGDTVKRASMASVLCKIAGQRVPIHPGRRDAFMLSEEKQPGFRRLWRWSAGITTRNFSQGRSRLNFCATRSGPNPGEVTLLGIGPPRQSCGALRRG